MTTRPRLGLPLLIVILVGLFGLTAWLWWLGRPEPLPLPPPLTCEQLLALPDDRRVAAAMTDLRERLQAAGPTSGAWRSWPAAAQYVLALSWAVADVSHASLPAFPGFAGLAGNRGRDLPQAEDIAVACEALEQSTAAAALRRGAAAAGAPAARLAELDRAALVELQRPGLVAGLRAYVRAHAAEIVAPR